MWTYLDFGNRRTITGAAGFKHSVSRRFEVLSENEEFEPG
jgi:hypothetical protein